MNLVIDVGNSFCKIAIFDQNIFIDKKSVPLIEAREVIKKIIDENNFDAAIISSVSGNKNPVTNLGEKIKKVFTLGPDSELPISVDYDNRKTLGADRIANSVAAAILYPRSNSLVVDCGTCITYNLVLDNSFSGGAISPGLQMRFKALNNFTASLPLVSPSQNAVLTGKSTEGSILSGVINGISSEIDGMIAAFCSQTAPLNVLLTGGDMPFFEQRLKSRTFAHPNLTVTGLNEILNYHSQ